MNQQSSYQGSVDFELTFEVGRDYVVKVSATNAEDQHEAVDDVRKAPKPLTVFD